uniref:Uncharacterized protein n=1 Tax=Calcidiscus leptoporus TaxID=127549 RepID=A0A6U5DT45_9EUKA
MGLADFPHVAVVVSSSTPQRRHARVSPVQLWSTTTPNGDAEMWRDANGPTSPPPRKHDGEPVCFLTWAVSHLDGEMQRGCAARRGHTGAQRASRSVEGQRHVSSASTSPRWWQELIRAAHGYWHGSVEYTGQLLYSHPLPAHDMVHS